MDAVNHKLLGRNDDDDDVCLVVVYVSGCTRFSYIFTSKLATSDEATQVKNYGPLGFDASCNMHCNWR